MSMKGGPVFTVSLPRGTTRPLAPPSVTPLIYSVTNFLYFTSFQ